MTLILFLLLQVKVIPSTSMSVPTVGGTTHVKLVWKDKNGVRGFQVLTNAQLAAIGNGIPAKPASFVGTAQQWKETWCHRDNDCAGPENGAVASLAGGRKDIGTASTEYELATIQQIPGGVVRVYVGDPDLDGFIDLKPSDILSGTGANITFAAKCGLAAAVAGKISGTVDLVCSKNDK